MKFLRSESYKKGILFSVGLNGFAKCLGFANSIAIAFCFGAQSKTDIYFYLFATVSLLISFIGSLDNSVIIPEAMRIREQEGNEKAKQFLNFFFYLYAGVGLIVVSILLIDPTRVLAFISSFDTGRLRQSQDLTFWFMPICLLMLLATYLTNILVSYKYFTLPILASIINNLFSIVFLLLLHRLLDVKSLVLALGAGYLFNIGILLYLMKRQLQWNFAFKRIAFDKRLRANIRYALTGNVASFFSGYAPFYILSNFNPGMITMFNYAKSLSEVPSQMVTAQFSAVSGIRFNELAAQGRHGELNQLFLQSLGFLLFILTPIAGIIFLFSGPMIAFLYHRGAFDQKAVEQTAFMLKFLGFSVIYVAVNTMVARLFMATQKLKEPIRFQILMNALFVAITYVSAHLFGITGFIAGMLLFQALMIVSVHWLMHRFFSYIRFADVLKAIVLNGVLNGSLVVLFQLTLPRSEASIYQVIFGGGVYLLLVVLINQLLGIDVVSKQYVSLLISRIRLKTALLLAGRQPKAS